MRGIGSGIGLGLRIVVAVGYVNRGSDGITGKQTGNGILLAIRTRHGLGLTVIGMARIIGLNGQRNGIVDSDDIIRWIRNNRDALLRTVAIHGRIGIISVKCRSLTGRQRFADGLRVSLISRNLYLSALQIMMDGVIGLIQVEVQLEYRDSATRRIDSNGIRIHLILMLNQFILIILGLSLICISNRYSFTSFGVPGDRQFVILLILC